MVDAKTFFMTLKLSAHAHAAPLRQNTLEVVTRYHLAWRERDLDTILSCYHSDIQYHDFFQNKVFTQVDIKSYIRASLPSAELIHIAPMRADGDTAFIEYSIRLQGQQGLASFRASEAITVKDGLIWRIHEYASLMGQENRTAQTTKHDLNRLGLSTRQVAAMSQDVRDYLSQPNIINQTDFNLQKLAEHTGYTRNQLSYLFNQVFGKRFLQYINELRIEWVLQHIHNPVKYSVDVLALDAGFNSSSVFYKYFRMVTGQSPKAYMKSDE
ncbi:MAG: AraC-like DNA-binding protein [Oceanicoccus sp.]